MRHGDRSAWGKAVAKLLPGDHIHYVAPISKDEPSSAVRIAVIDEARLRRMAKLQRRARQAGNK